MITGLLDVATISGGHLKPLSSRQNSSKGLATQPGYISVAFALFCFESYVSAGFSTIIHVPHGCCSEYYVAPPVISTRSKGILAAIEDMHNRTVVVETQYTLSKCLFVPDLQVGRCR